MAEVVEKQYDVSNHPGHVWRRALTLVEFHLTNQHRLYEKTMKKWFYGQLNNIFNIWGSLRMFSPAGKTVSV